MPFVMGHMVDGAFDGISEWKNINGCILPSTAQPRVFVFIETNAI